MKSALKILLYLLGFPVMVALVVLTSLHHVENAASYGIYAYGGIAVSVLLLVLYLVVGLITWATSRKAKTIKAIRISTAVLVLFSVFLTTGVWFAIDNVLPPILDDATDGTILFEDVVENFNAKSDVHKKLLDDFINMNCDNGNLDKSMRDQYLEEGYKNEEVKKLIHQNFTALHEDGYVTFRGPWLDFANSSRMTIPAVVHLIIDRRPIPEEELHPFILNGEEVFLTWSILDMTPDPIEIDLSGILGDASGILNLIQPYMKDLHSVINNAIQDENVANAKITISLDTESGKLSVKQSSKERGVFDYQNMAWFNSNNLLMLVISLFPMRHIVYVFGGIVAILSLLIGMIREKQYGAKLLKKEAAPVFVSAPDDNDGAANDEDNNIPMSPYMKTFVRSIDDANRRLNRF